MFNSFSYFNIYSIKIKRDECIIIVGICLSILLILTLLSVILGNDFIGDTIETVIDNEALIDDVSSTFEIVGTDIILNIDPIIGATAIIITIATFGAIIGIQILASGLSPESVKVLIIAIAYTGIWIVLSVLASPLIVDIEIFGSLIYVSLTIVYVIGVIQKIGGNK